MIEARPVVEVSELPEGAKPFASERATRWIMAVTFLALFALAVLCAVGPHIPSGE